MHVQINKQDHQQIDECTDKQDEIHHQNDDDDEDFEICTKQCVATDFGSDSEYRQHMLSHVRPLAVQVRRLDLDQFERIPNRRDSFRLTQKRDSLALGHHARIIVGGFRVELIDYSCLSDDCVYRVECNIVDPNLLEPITELWEKGPSGTYRRATLDVVGITAGGLCENANGVDDDAGSVIRVGESSLNPAPVAAPQRHQSHPVATTLQDLADASGMPVDYFLELLQSFSASHFITGSMMPRFMPRPATKICPPSAPSQVKLNQCALPETQSSIQPFPNIMEMNASSALGPKYRIPWIGTHSTSGAAPRSPMVCANLTSSTVSRVLPSSVNSTADTVSKALLTNTISAPSTVSRALMMNATSASYSSSVSHKQVVTSTAKSTLITTTSLMHPVASTAALTNYISKSNTRLTSTGHLIRSSSHFTCARPTIGTQSVALNAGSAAAPSDFSSLAPTRRLSPNVPDTASDMVNVGGSVASMVPNNMVSAKTFAQQRVSPTALGNGVGSGGGRGNSNLVAKRIPLSVRQPPYAKMTVTEGKAKSIGHSRSPVIVPAECPPSGVGAPAYEIIDLLSDDENDSRQNEVTADIRSHKNVTNDDIETIDLDD